MTCDTIVSLLMYYYDIQKLQNAAGANLLGTGDFDTAGETAMAVGKELPGLMVEAATHTAPIEQPTLINLHIRRFVNRCAQKVGRLTPAG